jgi:hypothetical protein
VIHSAVLCDWETPTHDTPLLGAGFGIAALEDAPIVLVSVSVIVLIQAQGVPGADRVDHDVMPNQLCVGPCTTMCAVFRVQGRAGLCSPQQKFLLQEPQVMHARKKETGLPTKPRRPLMADAVVTHSPPYLQPAHHTFYSCPHHRDVPLLSAVICAGSMLLKGSQAGQAAGCCR